MKGRRKIIVYIATSADGYINMTLRYKFSARSPENRRQPDVFQKARFSLPIMLLDQRPEISRSGTSAEQDLHRDVRRHGSGALMRVE